MFTKKSVDLVYWFFSISFIQWKDHLTWTGKFSGVYGSSTIAHVIGAWQIYEHSGNQTFLAKSYEFYKELFWDGIGGKHFGYGYQAVLCLNKMAAILGFQEDAIHWNAT